MVALLDVRLRGISARVGSIALAAALALATPLAGCAGKDLIVGEERPGASAGPDGIGGPGGVDGIVPAADVALLADCPLSADNWRERSECWSRRHAGRWRGFFTGVPRYATTGGRVAEFPPGDVLLELNAGGRGRMTFGAPQAGWSADFDMPLPPCGEPEGPPGCGQLGLLLPGFAYGLESVQLIEPQEGPRSAVDDSLTVLPAGMSFEVRVGEPWDGWCAAHASAPGACMTGDCAGADAPLPPPEATASSATRRADAPVGCRCSETGCRPDAPALRIELDMSVDSDALRGSYEPNDASIDQARLEFLKEQLP